MAATGNEAVTLKQLKMLRKSAEGVQFVKLFSGDAHKVTLPQPFDTYKVLFVCARTNDGYGSGVCVPPDNKARFYDGKYNQSVSFNGDTAIAPYAYGVTDIYAIA